MKMIFCPLASGSAGNCTYVSFGDKRFLIDAGISATKITNALKQLGLSPADLDGILVTHEHVDHVKGIYVFTRKYGVPIYANTGTWHGILKRDPDIPMEYRYAFETGMDFYLGNVNIMPFAIPHDANDPVGYVLRCSGLSAAVATDIGHINDEWVRAVSGSQAVLIEANHNVEMVLAGPYPYHLKQRILSRRGHLCNEDCARVLMQLYANGTQAAYLGHLSGENNTPEVAYDTVSGMLIEAGIRPGEDLALNVARRDQISDMVVLETPQESVRRSFF
ncbi:MAG: MBL fold metallo-hydrolase [Clostridia bacterium]|nr:MBL fold metallo-hydrolase [Clostridia bacterium]